MRHKKSDNQSDEESALEQRVDRMMDPHQPDEAGQATNETDTKETDAPPPIDIFKDSVGAPSVPVDVLDKLGVKDEADADSQSPESSEPETEGEKPDDSITADEPVDVATDPFADKKTDEAVDDIEKKDSDKVLAAEDAELAAAFTASKDRSFGQKLKHIFKKWWVWVLIVLAILGALYAVPFTRFHIAALFVKQQVTITVIDSVSHTPVSGASVTLNGLKATSNAQGKANFTVPVGHQTLQVQEKYYKNYSADVLVPLWGTGNQTAQIVATGRQVRVKVINKLTGSPVSGAEVRVLDTKATTDKDGKAIIVLPAGKSTIAGKVQAQGYNTADVTVAVLAKIVGGNTFSITPVGRVYFLSEASGKVDVVGANLDGTDRQTVLAGTGNEDPSATILSSSPDWKYLALESTRAQTPNLFLINTARSNKLTTVDNSGADITPIGWSGHNLVYIATYSTMPQWQAGRQALKSFNADSGKVSVLAQTQATGTSSSYAYQTLANVNILGGEVFYTTQWLSSSSDPTDPLLSGKNNAISTVNLDGTGQKDIKTFDPQTYGEMQAEVARPGVLYIAVRQQNATGHTFYQFSDNAITTPTSLNEQTYTQAYPMYLLSPSGHKTLWSEAQSSQTVLRVGDGNGQNAKTIATLDAGYAAEGWYTDGYVLVLDKDGNLYSLSAGGLSSNIHPSMIGQ